MKDILIILIIIIIMYFIFFTPRCIQSDSMTNTEIHKNHDYNINQY